MKKMKAEAFAHDAMVEICTFLPEFEEIEDISLEIPYSLTELLYENDSFSNKKEKLLNLVKKLNHFQWMVNKITIQKNKGFNHTSHKTEMFTTITFRLIPEENKGFFNKILNFFRKDNLEKHRTVVGLFNVIFLNNENNIERITEKKENSGCDHPPLITSTQ